MSKKIPSLLLKRKTGQKNFAFLSRKFYSRKKKEQKVQVNSKDVSKKGPTVLLDKQI